MASNLDILIDFCNRNSSKNKSMKELYIEFNTKHKEAILRPDFEIALLFYKHPSAILSKEKCLKFAVTYGKSNYFFRRFVKEVEDVTRAFWSEVVFNSSNKLPVKFSIKLPDRDDNDDEKSYTRLLPNDWSSKSFSDKAEFTLKVQHDGFLKFILNSDPKLKAYYDKLRESRDPRLKLYVTLFSIPAEEYSLESKKLLKKFVEALNNFGRAKLQYVECSEPNIVEIREIR